MFSQKLQRASLGFILVSDSVHLPHNRSLTLVSLKKDIVSPVWRVWGEVGSVQSKENTLIVCSLVEGTVASVSRQTHVLRIRHRLLAVSRAGEACRGCPGLGAHTGRQHGPC